MSNASITTRILEAVQGDSAAIQALAGAIARGDGAEVRAVLGARGVTLSDQEAGDVVQLAAGGGTMTCTCT
jgi:hypothetical protein